VILFFWPMRASSWNQISMTSTSTAFCGQFRPGERGSFFEILDRALDLGVVAWPRRELAIAHGPQFPAQGLFGDGDAEFLVEPLRQIDQPPAHHAMGGRDWAAIDHLRNGLALNIIELRWLARRLAVKQAGRAPCIKPEHPIPDDLKPDPAVAASVCVAPHRSPQVPEAAAPAGRLLSSSPSPAAAPHQNPPATAPEPAWRTSFVRHVESEPN
jgi:hypothetical protein